MSDMELEIPISKAKRNLTVDVNDLTQDQMTEALKEGLKVILNAKMTKIKTSEADEDSLPEMQEAAFLQAQTNLADFKSGKRKSRTASADGTKLSGALKTEAMRISRNMVKDTLKAKKIPIREVPAATITAAATKLLSANPAIIEQAKANLASRPAVEGISLAGLDLARDPKLTAKYAAEKAEKKSQLSAATADKVKPRRQMVGSTAH